LPALGFEVACFNDLKHGWRIYDTTAAFKDAQTWG
jgi:hypothetical protein